jgi:hypothetical protein
MLDDDTCAGKPVSKRTLLLLNMAIEALKRERSLIEEASALVADLEGVRQRRHARSKRRPKHRLSA